MRRRSACGRDIHGKKFTDKVERGNMTGNVSSAKNGSSADKSAEYRKQLGAIEWELNKDFDNRVMILAGGAFGVSITFIKEIVGKDNVSYAWMLMLSWGLLILCLTILLINIYIGLIAYRQAIVRLDAGKHPLTWISKIIVGFNIAGLVSLIGGLLFLALFSFFNLGGNHAPTTTATPKTATSAAAPCPAARAAPSN
jgi:hypothetical protein